MYNFHACPARRLNPGARPRPGRCQQPRWAGWLLPHREMGQPFVGVPLAPDTRSIGAKRMGVTHESSELSESTEIQVARAGPGRVEAVGPGSPSGSGPT